MQNALEAALAETNAAGGTRLYKIRLRVGALSGAVPDALQFAFDALTRGTAAEGACLEIEPVPAQFWCEKCRSTFRSEDQLGECLGCGNFSPHLRSGRELEIASLEIE